MKAIPKTIEECCIALEKNATEEEIEYVKSLPKGKMYIFHDNVGRWIRNNWGLWSGSKLKDYLEELGFTHADDMSGVILDCFWDHLQGNSNWETIEESIIRYANHWDQERVSPS